jgi:predicted ATPase
VFFDRGLPECLGHMRLLGLQAPPGFEAELRLRRYARTVFVARPWPEIYVRDRWRQADFERAARSFEPTVLAYTDDGYAACVVPQVSVAERVEFILRQLDAGG